MVGRQWLAPIGPSCDAYVNALHGSNQKSTDRTYWRGSRSHATYTNMNRAIQRLLYLYSNKPVVARRFCPYEDSIRAFRGLIRVLVVDSRLPAIVPFARQGPQARDRRALELEPGPDADRENPHVIAKGVRQQERLRQHIERHGLQEDLIRHEARQPHCILWAEPGRAGANMA